jgi:hypothetical protein
MPLVWCRIMSLACFGLLQTLTVTVPAQAQQPTQSLSGALTGGAVGQQFPPLPFREEQVNSLIDGNRQGFASAWTNNFCLRWTDGCSTCSREEVWDPIRCERHDDSACTVTRVRCEAEDQDALLLSCPNVSDGVNWCPMEDIDLGELATLPDVAKSIRRLCTRRGPPPGYKIDSICSEDWSSWELRNCNGGDLAARERCQRIVAGVAAARAARPKMSFPGLRR